MLTELYRADYDVVIMESQLDREKANEHLQVLAAATWMVSCLALRTVIFQRIEAWEHKAVIALDTENVTSINYDNQQVINSALTHLADQGNLWRLGLLALIQAISQPVNCV